MGALDGGDREDVRARPVAGRALRRERPRPARSVRTAGSDRARARRGEHLCARRLSRARRGDRALCRGHAGERRPRRRRRRPHPALRPNVCRSRRRRRGRPRADVSGLSHRGVPGGRRGRRPGSGRDVLLPPEQPDRGARRAARSPTARRRRGLLRVRGRDCGRPHRGRRGRHPHVLEVVRARRCACRVRARGRSDSRGAEPAAGAAAHLGHLGGACTPGTRRSALRRSATTCVTWRAAAVAVSSS